jgi:hypothetical protein
MLMRRGEVFTLRFVYVAIGCSVVRLLTEF